MKSMTAELLYTSKVVVILAFFALSAPFITVALSAPPPAIIDTDAGQILRQSCDALERSPRFSLHAEIIYDEVLSSGQKLQFGGLLDALVRRPDRLRTDYSDFQRKSRIWYDGRTVTILDLSSNLYATATAPPSIDELLDATVEELGFSIPLADLYAGKPCSTFTKHVRSGYYVGIDRVNGSPAHHLAFVQDEIDWQIWIDSGDPPLPLKLLITYKNMRGSPQYEARITSWNLSPDAADSDFSAKLSDDAEKIEFSAPDLSRPHSGERK